MSWSTARRPPCRSMRPREAGVAARDAGLAASLVLLLEPGRSCRPARRATVGLGLHGKPCCPGVVAADGIRSGLPAARGVLMDDDRLELALTGRSNRGLSRWRKADMAGLALLCASGCRLAGLAAAVARAERAERALSSTSCTVGKPRKQWASGPWEHHAAFGFGAEQPCT